MSAPANPGMARWQRLLLPGGLLEGGGTRRSARDWTVDVLMTLVALGISGALLESSWDDHSGPWYVVDLLLGLVSLVLLWIRRSHPVAVGVITGVASVVSAAAGGPALLALFNAAIRAPWAALAAISALGFLASVVFPLIYPGEDSYELSVLLGLLVTVVVIGWGLFVRARRELVLSLRERAARLEAEQRLHVEQARDAERRRIAREMHDVLAHRISLLTLHAGALEFRPDAPPEEIAQAAGVIRAAAHSAQQELREVIGVLREGEHGTERPQPTLADVPELVAESRDAGMRVECRIDTSGAEGMPEALGRTAYRIVQEGLTNARKHAPAAAVDVAIRVEPGPQLLVEVLSRRAVGVAAGPAERPGTGLIGLAERVELAGGELDHGLDLAGDFVLRARLPWSP